MMLISQVVVVRGKKFNQNMKSRKNIWPLCMISPSAAAREILKLGEAGPGKGSQSCKR